MKRRRVIVAALSALIVAVAAASGLYVRFGRSIAMPMIAAAPGEVSVHIAGPGTLQARVPVTLSARITAGRRI